MFAHSEMNPESLTDSMVRSIGQNYLKKHPSETLLYNEQIAATLLASFDPDCSSVDRWKILLEAYAKLKSINGSIPQQIEALYIKAWKTLPKNTYELSTQAETVDVWYKPSEYASILMDQIKNKLNLLEPSEKHFRGIGYRLGAYK